MHKLKTNKHVASKKPSAVPHSRQWTLLSISRQHFKQQRLSFHSKQQGFPAPTLSSMNKSSFSRFSVSRAKQPTRPPGVVSGWLPGILSPSQPPHPRCLGSCHLPSSRVLPDPPGLAAHSGPARCPTHTQRKEHCPVAGPRSPSDPETLGSAPPADKHSQRMSSL